MTRVTHEFYTRIDMIKHGHTTQHVWQKHRQWAAGPLVN